MLDYGLMHAEMDLRVEEARQWGVGRDWGRQATAGKQSWVAQQAGRLACELDYVRLALAKRLEHFRVAQTVLLADRTHLFSSGGCA
jgi:hypothetical protein